MPLGANQRRDILEPLRTKMIISFQILGFCPNSYRFERTIPEINNVSSPISPGFVAQAVTRNSLPHVVDI